MTENVFKALEILMIILLFALAWFIFWGSIMGVQALWKKLKKMETNDRKKHDEIIVKQRDDLAKIQEESKLLDEKTTKRAEQLLKFDEMKERLEREIKELEEKKKTLNELEDQEETVEEENQQLDVEETSEAEEEAVEKPKKTYKKTTSKSTKK